MITNKEKLEIRELILNKNKIFLDKDCSNEHIRHSFYYKEHKFGYSFYHVSYTSIISKEKSTIKDYPTIEIPIDKKNELFDTTLNTMVTEIVNYVNNKGYEISCDRKGE